jgi:hypothetical protein
VLRFSCEREKLSWGDGKRRLLGKGKVGKEFGRLERLAGVGSDARANTGDDRGQIWEGTSTEDSISLQAPSTDGLTASCL